MSANDSKKYIDGLPKIQEKYKSEISRTDTLLEQVMYLLLARLLGRLHSHKTIFPDDLKHLEWDNILRSQPEEQMRLINGLPTRKEQEAWQSCPWMNMFQFFRSGLKNTYLKGISSCFQEVECRLTNPNMLSELIEWVNSRPINDEEFIKTFYGLMTVITNKVQSNHIEYSIIFRKIMEDSSFVNLITNLISPSSNDIVCDPVCGDGTILTKIILASNPDQKSKENPIQFYGFDTDIFSAKLAAINTLFYDITNASINCINPLDRQSKFYYQYAFSFDKVVAIPPFGQFLDTEIVPDELEPFAKSYRSEIVYLGLAEQLLNPKGLGVVCIPSINLVGTKTKDIRKVLVEQNQLEAIIFFSIAEIEHALLVFKKGDNTDNVLFYKLILEKKETEKDDAKVVDTLTKSIDTFFEIWKEWQHRKNNVSTVVLKKLEDRNNTCFFVPKDEIESQQYILAFEKYHKGDEYKSSEIPEPSVILQELNEEEEEIKGYLKQLHQNLGKKND